MNSNDYWRERFEQLEESLNQDIQNKMPQIDRIYREAERDIEKEILAWYQRLAENNGISMAEARKLLDKDELEEFHWDVEEYIKRAQENAVSKEWVKELENASAKFHISRLEALKLNTQQSLETVFGNQLDMLDKLMREQYEESYYRTAFEVQRGFNVGWPIGRIDQDKLDKILSKPWAPDGRNFSERIWNNRAKLVNEIHSELARMCITGEGPDRAIEAISKKMNTSRHNAGRLVMTESAYFDSAARKDAFGRLGVERYEIVATLDARTSEICQEMDGKVFDMKDYEAGVTAPPFHVYCRSCTCPYFDDDFGEIGERAARDTETGKTYYVPADMKYPEWKKSIQKADDGGISKLKMANRGCDWSKTKPVKHIKEEFQEIIEYAKARGINVYAVNRFDGDIDLLKEQIDIIADMQKEYAIPQKLTVTFKEMNDEDFAGTHKNTITFNTKALRNREITNENLKKDDWLAADDIKGIAAHEMGHIIARKYGNKGLEMARKAYYNIFGEEISTRNILLYLRETVSKYSVDLDERYKTKPFKTSYYKEVTSEIISKNETSPDRFSKECIRILKEMIT